MSAENGHEGVDDDVKIKSTEYLFDVSLIF